MKKGVILGLVIGLAIAGASLAFANSQISAILNEQIKVSLNGKYQTFKDETTGELQYPITYHDRTYLPLRNVAQLAGLSVDYDENTKTAILKNLSNIPTGRVDNGDWKSNYYYIISSTADTWDYDQSTKFGFAYFNNDEIPELVIGSNSTSLMIYSFDKNKNCAYLLRTATTGARGATGITYVERKSVINEQSAGMLFESEYKDVEGCIGGFGSWGNLINLETGWEESWSQNVYVLDDNDHSKDISEDYVSPEAAEYLAKEKEFELKYSKEEAKEIVLQF